MKQEDHPEVTLVSELSADWVQTLKTKSGTDIWLFGGVDSFAPFWIPAAWIRSR
jgi:hypothetical protein